MASSKTTRSDIVIMNDTSRQGQYQDVNVSDYQGLDDVFLDREDDRSDDSDHGEGHHDGAARQTLRPRVPLPRHADDERRGQLQDLHRDRDMSSLLQFHFYLSGWDMEAITRGRSSVSTTFSFRLDWRLEDVDVEDREGNKRRRQLMTRIVVPTCVEEIPAAFAHDIFQLIFRKYSPVLTNLTLGKHLDCLTGDYHGLTTHSLNGSDLFHVIYPL